MCDVILLYPFLKKKLLYPQIESLTVGHIRERERAIEGWKKEGPKSADKFFTYFAFGEERRAGFFSTSRLARIRF